MPKSGVTKATKPANKGKPKAKAQPPVKAREEEPHATTSEEAAATTSTAVTAPVEDAPECPNAFAKAEGEEEERNDADSAEEGEKGADGAQTRARMLQRHKQELREVKKARGKSKAEVKKMEHELRAKQQAELHALDRELAALRPKRVPKPPSPKVNDSDGSDDGETGSSDDDDAPSPGEKGPTPDSGEQQKGPKKPSRAARRKQKREAEDREREKRIEEERKNAGPSAKALEIRRLMDKLGPKGLRITEVAADGNCLYSAVGDQIKRSALSGPQSIVELRRLAADYILDHPDDFLPFLIAGEELPPGGLKKYCDELKRDGVWGGQLELRALAQSLKVPIVVHSADAPELKMGEEFQRDPLQLTFHRHYYALGEHYNSVAVAGEVNAE